jgi:hypothetical protein
MANPHAAGGTSLHPGHLAEKSASLKWIGCAVCTNRTFFSSLGLALERKQVPRFALETLVVSVSEWRYRRRVLSFASRSGVRAPSRPPVTAFSPKFARNNPFHKQMLLSNLALYRQKPFREKQQEGRGIKRRLGNPSSRPIVKDPGFRCRKMSRLFDIAGAAGNVVTREELQKRLWPDTFGDVDHNLNTAVNKIREALGDSSEHPRLT